MPAKRPTTETWWAVRIGSYPKDAPYFAIQDGDRVGNPPPRLFASREDAQAFIDAGDNKQWKKAVRVTVTEKVRTITRTGAKR